jgi:hypothetical protein
MSVNPNLAALMRVIEDNQDKMPEGEYLEAMNALGALHRQQQQQERQSRPLPFTTSMTPYRPPPPPTYAASAPLFTQFQSVSDMVEMSREERAAWSRVAKEHPQHNGMSASEWIQYSEEERNRMLREATEKVVDTFISMNNPQPEVCPFIARHAYGPWSFGTEHSYWECMCGYKGKSVYWQKHEQSERHQDWAKHRTVSSRKIDYMKKMIQRDDAEVVIRYRPLSATYTGGIGVYRVIQERNEWTHPELYAPIHRSPIPTADGNGKWFVHRRNIHERRYVN